MIFKHEKIVIMQFNAARRFKAELSLSKKNLLFAWLKAHGEKCSFFHLTSSVCSPNILVFVTTFWSCRKNYLIRKITLTLKFMTSEPGLQTIAIHILPSISQGISPHFVYDFSKKCFLCYILSTDQISLSDLLYFSRY